MKVARVVNWVHELEVLLEDAGEIRNGFIAIGILHFCGEVGDEKESEKAFDGFDEEGLLICNEVLVGTRLNTGESAHLRAAEASHAGSNT